MSGGAKAGYNPWVIAVVVTMAAFMEILDTTIVNVSLPHIAGSLSVSNDESTWSLTTYLVANGIVLTISGALSRRIGRKRYFLTCLIGFTVASVGCGVSTEFWQLLLCRGLQGLFGGGLQPTQQAIILDTFPPEKRASAFAITAVATVIAPVLGPLVGGYLTDEYSWHWIFLINLPIGIVTVFGVLQVVQDPPHVEEERKNAGRFDYIGLAFIVLALGFMEVAVDRGEDYDWLDSDFVRIAFGVSAFGYIGGVTYLLMVKDPVVNLRVFADRTFALSSILMALFGFVLYGSAVVVPQLVQQQLGYTATWAGLVLAPGALVLVVLIPIGSKLMSVVPAKWVIAFGGLCLALSLFYSSLITPQIDFAQLVVIRSTQTIGLAFLFAPLSTIAFATLPKELEGDATALFTMLRNFMGGIGISVSTAMVTNREQIRQAYLVDHMSPLYEPYNDTLQRIQQSLVNMGRAPAEAAELAMGQMNQQLQLQSAMLAYSDVFLLTGLIALPMVPIALFLTGKKVEGGGGAA